MFHKILMLEKRTKNMTECIWKWFKYDWLDMKNHTNVICWTLVSLRLDWLDIQMPWLARYENHRNMISWHKKTEIWFVGYKQGFCNCNWYFTVLQTVEEMLKDDAPDWHRVLEYVESIYRHFEMWCSEYASWS